MTEIKHKKQSDGRFPVYALTIEERRIRVEQLKESIVLKSNQKLRGDEPNEARLVCLSALSKYLLCSSTILNCFNRWYYLELNYNSDENKIYSNILPNTIGSEFNRSSTAKLIENFIINSLIQKSYFAIDHLFSKLLPSNERTPNELIIPKAEQILGELKKISNNNYEAFQRKLYEFKDLPDIPKGFVSKAKKILKFYRIDNSSKHITILKRFTNIRNSAHNNGVDDKGKLIVFSINDCLDIFDNIIVMLNEILLSPMITEMPLILDEGARQITELNL
jgi:hypothetical protein